MGISSGAGGSTGRTGDRRREIDRGADPGSGRARGALGDGAAERTGRDAVAGAWAGVRHGRARAHAVRVRARRARAVTLRTVTLRTVTLRTAALRTAVLRCSAGAGQPGADE